MSSPADPQNAEESETLSETASKLERLKEMTRKYGPSEGSEREEETEQALETHEVVELQAFVRRKEWIEEKIRFLERLPPIDIFAGVQELSKTHDQISTLATRAQFDEWVAEHDKIEKETEVLDAGDLKKLKAVTKAATQRNLSPEDTDLIEITLNTLFTLDRLLHLLRERSEQLDLLGSRLTWEEQRSLAYSTRSELLSNIQSFLDTRARWRADIYNGKGINTSNISLDLPFEPTSAEPRDPFSRSARFKLSEELSRDVVQLSSRISLLRHGPVLISGKVLDKLIEDSRKPVSEPMLDEQDRVEEKCEKDLSSVGKFLMAVNMQWKKADEVYVETRKDLTALEALSDEVQSALTQLPSRRNETVFTNRIDFLKKRIQSRVDQPTALPLPEQALFPDQVSFNADLVSTLSNELSQARSVLSKVDHCVSSYRAGCDAVDEVEKLRKELLELQEGVMSTTDRLRTGFDSDDGDGSPPDLTQNSCVELVRFSAFLAMLPSLSERSSEIEESALKSIKRSRLASLRLVKPGIGDDFRQDFAKEVEGLEDRLRNMVKVRSDVSLNVSRLREVRRIWSAMDQVTKSVDAVTPELKEALVKNRWKQQTSGESAPPTPESPRSDLPAASATPESVNDQILSIKEHLEHDVVSPFVIIGDTIPASLHEVISARKISIERSILDLQSMNRLLVDVRGQTSAMETILEEVHTLEGRIEDSKIQYDDHYDSMLLNIEPKPNIPTSDSVEAIEEGINVKEQALSRSVDATQSDVTKLVDSLPMRVPLISRYSPSSSAEGAPSSGARSSLIARLPFDPAAVDRVVRSDTNAYAIRLTGGVKSLQQKRSFGAFYRAARDMSRRVTLVRRDIRSLTDQLEQLGRELEELSDAPLDGADDGLSALVSLRDCLENIEKVDAVRLRRSIVAIRDDVSRMETIPEVQDDVTARDVLNARAHTLEEVNSHSHRILDRLEALRAEVVQAEQAELSSLAEKAREDDEAAEAEIREQARRQKEQEEAARLAKDIFEEEASIRLQEESTPKRDVRWIGLAVQEDVFGPHSPLRQEIDKETAELLALIRSLRKQLKSIGLNSVVRPSGASHRRSPSATLPQPETANSMVADFAMLEAETSKLPISAENTTADTELRSLRLEMEASRELLSRVQQLARLQYSVVLCDATFSVFLDHIDSYPNLPQPADGTDPDPSELDALVSPGDRLSEKMSHAKDVVSDMSEHFGPVADDPRAIAEHGRLKQTWEELMEMALEKISGRNSRAGSASTCNSSGRNSSTSMRSVNVSEGKRSRYANLSISGRDGLLAPSNLTKRRATSASSAGSGSTKQSQKHSSKPSLSISKAANSRSVSGPMKQTATSSTTQPSRSVFNSTFASRQRTASISSNTSSTASVSRPRASTVSRRRMSSTLSETPRAASPALSTSTRGTWSRAPRQSFSSFQRAETPERTQRKPNQKYVANPKNKLDVALGDVINNLPVDINVEVVADTWKDKSGKYWIGGNEPKLCFCRILRSQTVMVRVGGGWTELSKFIKDHFSDLFRMLPETPPRPGSGSKERWISAATLRNAEDGSSFARSSGSPDSIGRKLPSFAISTPDGTDKSGSPRGSPLTPIQFIRRADADASEISLSSIAISNDLSTSGISISSIRPRRRMSSVSSKVIWKP